jgi:hypothetical protein
MFLLPDLCHPNCKVFTNVLSLLLLPITPVSPSARYCQTLSAYVLPLM